MATLAKKINVLDAEKIRARLAGMIAARKLYEDIADKLHVYISAGNRKTGAIPSVSLIPVADCANCAACSGSCYDLRNDCIYNGVKDTRARNSAIFRADPAKYFREISEYCAMIEPKYFRWHIGGDIVNSLYLAGMVKVATENPGTIFLAYTKSNKIVNQYIEAGGIIPENLTIIFSNWFGAILENPYNLPTSNPLNIDGETTTEKAGFVCPGNCLSCKKCFKAQAGDAVIFPLH